MLRQLHWCYYLSDHWSTVEFSRKCD